jgi:hypothetical protein
VAKDVRTTPQADLHILELDAWWREHRDKPPDLFEQELTIALRTTGTVPMAGKVYAHSGARVRRFLMRATRNHVYYIKRGTTFSLSRCGEPSKAVGRS